MKSSPSDENENDSTAEEKMTKLSANGRVRLRTLLMAQDEHGYTALMNAAALDDSNASLAISRLFLEHARRAAQEDDSELAFTNELLDLRDSLGYSCVHWAAACNNPETVRFFVRQCGADVDAAGHDGETPLHRSCRFGAEEPTRALLECGAKADIRNTRFLTPLDVAGYLGRNVNRKARDRLRAIVLSERPKMKTLLLHHPDCLMHESHKVGHQESPDRIRSVLRLLRSDADGNDGNVADWAKRELTLSTDFPEATPKQALRVHRRKYLALVERLARTAERTGKALPFTPHVQKAMRGAKRVKKDMFCDTSLSPGSRRAALRAAGSVVHAVDRIFDGTCASAFCLVRPPGHHAGPEGLEGATSCGFCILNSVAIGAAHALREYGSYFEHSATGVPRAIVPRCSRVAIVDFDVHHGNGTQRIVQRLSQQYPNRLFFCSLHLYDHETGYQFYPGTGKDDDLESNVLNIALAPIWRSRNGSKRTGDPQLDRGSPSPVQTGRKLFRQQVLDRLVPALRAFGPDLILISAGFDGAKHDVGNQKLGCATVLQGMDLAVQDYHWLTERIMTVARICCSGRVVSVLEGGYGQCCPTPGSKRKRGAEKTEDTNDTETGVGKRAATTAYTTPTASPNPLRTRPVEAPSADSPDMSAFQIALEAKRETLPDLDRQRFARSVVAHIKAITGSLFS